MQRFKPLLLRLALQATLAVPDETLRWLIGRNAEKYRGQTLHPKVQLGLSVIKLAGMTPLDDFTPHDARGRSDSYFDLLDIPKVRLPFVKDETALAIDKVRYMGEPVAAVHPAPDRGHRHHAAQVDHEREQRAGQQRVVEHVRVRDDERRR